MFKIEFFINKDTQLFDVTFSSMRRGPTPMLPFVSRILKYNDNGFVIIEL